MTQSNKVLLRALLNLEHEFIKSEHFFENNQLFFFIHINSNNSFDLFNIITTAFPISQDNYDSLYDILHKFNSNILSIDETINSISLLVH